MIWQNGLAICVFRPLINFLANFSYSLNWRFFSTVTKPQKVVGGLIKIVQLSSIWKCLLFPTLRNRTCQNLINGVLDLGDKRISRLKAVISTRCSAQVTELQPRSNNIFKKVLSGMVWQFLRRNPPKVRVTSGKLILYRDYLRRLANFCATVLKIFQKYIF